MPSLAEENHREPTPLVALNIETFRANKTPFLHAILSCIFKSESCAHGTFEVYQIVHIHVRKKHAKLLGTIPTPSASFGQLKGCRSPANKLLAN